MPDRELSSLDRLISQRGAWLAGYLDSPSRVKRLLIAAGINGGLGLAMLGAGLAGAFGHGLESLVPGLAMLYPTAILFGASRIVSDRIRKHQLSEVRLTQEARELLQTLLTHLQGWSLHRARRRRRLRRAGRAAQRGLFDALKDRRCEDILAPAAFDLLERAAEQYNRVQGALALEAEAPAESNAVQRLGPNIRAAMDEALAEVLHVAALIHRLPESAAASALRAEGRIQELRELADQLETLRSEADRSTQALDSPTRLQSVLEELRAERVARREIDEAPAVQRIGQTRQD